ncbi:MAG: ABC transporter ATP-binding protein [Rikenellaceae bacterium]
MKEKKPSILSRLFHYGAGIKHYTIIGMVLSGVSAVVGLLPFVFIWLCVRELFTSYPAISGDSDALRFATMAVATAIGSILIYIVALLCTHKSAFRIATNIRVAAMSHLMKLPLGYFSANASGRLRRTVNDSASRTETFLAHQLPDLVGAYITPIAVIVLVFAVNWRLGLICFIPAFLAFACQASAMGSKYYKASLIKYEESLAAMNSEAVEYVRGIPVVKTFGQSIFSFKRFHQTIIDYRDYVIEYTLWFRTRMGLFQTFMGSITIFLIGGGVWLFGGNIDPKAFILDFVFYIFITPMLSVMLMRIMWTSQDVGNAENAMDGIDALLAEKPLARGKEERFPLQRNIQLSGVSFTYPNAKSPALKGVSIEVEEGQTVALVGTSGGGKSTIAALMARFWDAGEGVVSIGGVDVKDIAEKELMQNISFVFQNTNLYKSSILDNVRESRPDATEAEVLKALNAARCNEIIERLPNGIHTVAGKDGVFFSGGEAQRIAIARAILKEAPIILLDEATAFTDPENEYQIQQALSELSKGKTVVIVAHSLSTIQDVDKIYVVEKGEIAEQGSHAQLLVAKGLYAKMWAEYQTIFSWNTNRE